MAIIMNNELEGQERNQLWTAFCLRYPAEPYSTHELMER
jgi:hypothetical protein